MTEANAQVSEAEIKEVVVDDTTATDEQADKTTDAGKQDETSAAADTGAADAGADDKGEGDADKPAALPDNWRELAAGEDEDAAKLLKRYGSMNGVVKALMEAQKTIRSGKVKRDAPDPKDEKAMAEWRKEQGIPDTAEGYKLPEPLTKRLIDEDKPILSNFMERMHGKHWTPQLIAEAAEWYIDKSEEAETQQRQADDKAHEAAEDYLREAWSRDEFKGNLQLAHRFWEGTGVPELANARLPDGRRIGDIPEFIIFSSDKGREAFGDVVFSSSDSEQKHNSRRAEIEKIRDTDFDRYEAEGLDKELNSLIERDLKRGKK